MTSTPTPVSASTSDFASLGLSPAVCGQARRADLKTPTAIQNSAIPVLLKRQDAELLAPTGTGKTACYLLPLFDQLLKRGKATALVIVPTRELARQVAEMGGALAPSPDLRPFAVYGGAQEDRENSPAETVPPPNARVVIATPGRLLDLFRGERLDTTHCRFLVLDEGDRLMANEFREEMQGILALLPKDRQTVLVSATGSAETMKAAQAFLHKPVRIAPSRAEKPTIRQAVLFVDKAGKPAAIEALLRRHPDRSAIVFTATREEASQLATHLRKRGLKVAALHGGLTQPARNASVTSFTSGKAVALIATDIAARGLDIEQVGQVINTTPPDQPDTYLHRIGRTGRAGRAGWAATLCTPEERKTMRRIESTLKLKLTVLPVPSLTTR